MSVIPQTPGWALSQLTSTELEHYREQLETALSIAPEGSADALVIKARLQGVNEQVTERASIRMRAAYGPVYQDLISREKS